MGVEYVEQYLTVSQLTKYIARKFEYDPYLERVFLKGEISNFNPRRKGSVQYFNLKDEGSIISAVLFAGPGRNIRFDLEEGMSVLVEGQVQVYQRGGNYQIIIRAMQPDGIGALFLAYEQTKEKLSKEGLFSQEQKKQIPKYPKRIGVITSPSGAVIQDILTTIKRRYPIAEVVLFPTIVQGEKSADSIVESIGRAEEKGNLDTLIIGRGGGSFEDLFSFNEEKVVRAIANMTIPVISSVGHETDTTLTDLVADLRAATPTAAAELAVPVLTEELLKIDEYSQRMTRAFQTKITFLTGQLNKITHSVIFRQPERLYDGYLQNVDQLEVRLHKQMSQLNKENQQSFKLLEQRLRSYPIKSFINEKDININYLTEQLQQAVKSYIKDRSYKVDQLMQALDHLSPLKILARGYAVVEKEDIVVKKIDDVHIGDRLTMRLFDGQVEAIVEHTILNEEE